MRGHTHMNAHRSPNSPGRHRWRMHSRELVQPAGQCSVSPGRARRHVRRRRARTSTELPLPQLPRRRQWKHLPRPLLFHLRRSSLQDCEPPRSPRALVRHSGPHREPKGAQIRPPMNLLRGASLQACGPPPSPGAPPRRRRPRREFNGTPTRRGTRRRSIPHPRTRWRTSWTSSSRSRASASRAPSRWRVSTRAPFIP